MTTLFFPQLQCEICKMKFIRAINEYPLEGEPVYCDECYEDYILPVMKRNIDKDSISYILNLYSENTGK